MESVGQLDEHGQVVVDLEEQAKPTTKREPLEVEEEEDEHGHSLLTNNPLGDGTITGVPTLDYPISFLYHYLRPQGVGNMHILFPEHLRSSGWGVVGPQWFGPACVWLLLVVSTHFCIHRAQKLGFLSVMICYMFLAAATYNLTDVSLRDPGICFYKEVPSNEEHPDSWRWCDFCQGYQPPNGAHCADCGVCIEGYDHHCVWMGTCIGKKNYRQFVRFNVTWLYYLGYLFLWLITFGPFFHHR